MGSVKGIFFLFLIAILSWKLGLVLGNPLSSTRSKHHVSELSVDSEISGDSAPSESNVGGNRTGHGHSNDTGHNESHHEAHRYQVAHFDFENVGTPFIISVWVVLASAAKIGFHLNNKLSSIFPESCLLILLGVILGVILWAADVTRFVLNSHTFFFYLLPPIILDAGYFMPNRAFFDNIGTILLYAVVGTLFNTLLIGFSVWGFSKSGGIGAIPYDLDILHCLVFASLLAAVDPVAVLAVFEEIHVNEVLHIVVFGESLLNDGVTVVLYHMFEGYSEIGAKNIIAVDVVAGVASFFIVALGGTAVGILFGLLTALISRFTDHVRVIEPLLVFVMGYLSYLTAEMFHLSGILSCTFCAITMKKYVEANISQKSHTTIKYFMKMLASVSETVIFMLLGISTVNANHEWNTEFVLLTLAFCIVFRAAGVLLLTVLANHFRLVRLSLVDQFIMAYGGLRGAIAFSLVITLNSKLFPQQGLFVTTTLVVIYFTVFIQGATIKPLVNLLGVKKADTHKPTMNEQIHGRFLDHLMAGVEDITGFHGHHKLRMIFEHVNEKYLKPVLVRKKSMRSHGLSILNVYQKLNEKEARDMLRDGSFNDLRQLHHNNHHHLHQHMSHSMADHIAYANLHGSDSQIGTSVGSLPLPDTNSSTQLDLQALDAPETRKMRDDGKIHHIMSDAMFRPRKRFARHRRHMLPDSEPAVHQPFHHKARMHLRHVLNHNLHQAGTPNGHSNGGHSENGDVANGGKPRKNVSFGMVTQLYGGKDSDGEGDRASIQAEAEDTASDASSLREDLKTSSSSHSGIDDEASGIIFTARSLGEDELEGCPAVPPMEPTALEMSLPWKRNTGRDPLSSSFTHSLPDDHHPLRGEAPSWVNNNEYTTASQVEVPDTVGNHSTSQDTHNAQNNGPQVAHIELDSLLGSSPAGNNTKSAQNNHTNNANDHDAAHVNGDQDLNGNLHREEEEGLPLPWKCQSNGDEVCINVDEQDAPEACPMPAPAGYAAYEVQELAPKKEQVALDLEKTLEEEEDVLPPPWRDNGNSVSISPPCDTKHSLRSLHNKSLEDNSSHIPPPPWRQNSIDNMPVRSPSVGHDLENFSMAPQPSCQSFRISEAESKHSEPHPVHHIIDKPPHTRGIYPVDGGDDVLHNLPDEEPLMSETMDRVNKWLFNTESPEQDAMQPWQGLQASAEGSDADHEEKGETKKSGSQEILPKKKKVPTATLR